MHELIEKIVVHEPDKSSGHREQEVEIHFRFNVLTVTSVIDGTNNDKKAALHHHAAVGTRGYFFFGSQLLSETLKRSDHYNFLLTSMT